MSKSTVDMPKIGEAKESLKYRGIKELKRKKATRDESGMLDSDIILCKYQGKYVTWIQNVDSSQSGSTYRGNYFDNKQKAIQDFRERS